jgi:hypothetical protein
LGAEEGAEKVVPQSTDPSAAKAGIESKSFAAWLKPRPFKTGPFSAAFEGPDLSQRQMQMQMQVQMQQQQQQQQQQRRNAGVLRSAQNDKR